VGHKMTPEQLEKNRERGKEQIKNIKRNDKGQLMKKIIVLTNTNQ
jgi:hypothetical protein